MQEKQRKISLFFLHIKYATSKTNKPKKRGNKH